MKKYKVEETERDDYKNAIDELNNLRRKFLRNSTGPTHQNLEHKLKAKHYHEKITEHKRNMRIKGWL